MPSTCATGAQAEGVCDGEKRRQFGSRLAGNQPCWNHNQQSGRSVFAHDGSCLTPPLHQQRSIPLEPLAKSPNRRTGKFRSMSYDTERQRAHGPISHHRPWPSTPGSCAGCYRAISLFGILLAKVQHTHTPLSPSSSYLCIIYFILFYFFPKFHRNIVLCLNG